MPSNPNRRARVTVISAASAPHFRLNAAQRCVLVLLATLGSAHAQTQAQTTLPEVSVSATRQSDTALGLTNQATSGSHVGVSVQDLPASLATVSSEQMRERGDFSLTDAVVRSVGITANGEPGNGGLSFSSRGFTGVNSVGIAEDGLMLGVAAGTLNYPSEAWGYERIDVLRGPGALMYGSGTTGATINAVRKQPSRERSTDVLVGAGSHGQVRLGLGTTGAINDTLSYRIDAYGQHRDGERVMGRDSSSKLMTGLRWQPNTDLKVDLTADIADQKPERYFGSPVIDGKIVRSLRFNNYNVRDADDHFKDKRVRLKAEWNANDWLQLKNEVYWFKADRHWRNAEEYSYDPKTGLVAQDSYLEIGHDLEQKGNRVSADMKLGAHRVALGWDFSRADFKSRSNSPYSTETTYVDAQHPDQGWWSSPDPYIARGTTRLRQNAIFIEDAWNLSNQWLLMGGIRRDFYNFDQRNLITNALSGVDLAGTSWRLGATYRLTERSSVYAQLSQGHDPVGSLVTLSATQTSYKLTKGRQAEVGFKQQLPDDRGEVAVALFDITKKDIITRDPQRPTISVQGGKQSSRGIELSGAYKVNSALRFDGNVAYLRAKFDELLEGGTGANRAGNRPANVPKTTANLWGHYRVGAWQASLGLRYSGDRYANNANTSRLPAYTVADAALRWDVSQTTAVSLVVRNLANRVYATTAYYDNQWFVAPGRNVELMGQFRF